MKNLSAGEWDIRVAGVYRDALNLTVYMDSNEARLDFGDGRSHVSAIASRDATLVSLGDMRLLVGSEKGTLVVYKGGGDWLVLWEGPLGRALAEQEASPIQRRTPGETEAYQQGYRAALQYVREKTVQALDGLDGVLLP